MPDVIIFIIIIIIISGVKGYCCPVHPGGELRGGSYQSDSAQGGHGEDFAAGIKEALPGFRARHPRSAIL